MTNQQQALAKAIYDAIKARAKALNFVDKMVLMSALNNNHEFGRVPADQQKLFLEVGMAAIRALEAHSKAAQG